MFSQSSYPVGNYMFKVNTRNTRTRCEIWSKLTIKLPERRKSVNKGVLRNFAKFTGKHLCHSLFFKKVPGLGLFLPPASFWYLYC